MEEVLYKFEVNHAASGRQQLADHVRELILSGQLLPGYKFPPSKELSCKWGLAECSVHAAMSALTKEGLLVRTPKRGTFVAQRKPNLTHVGIYVAQNFWKSSSAAFWRALVMEVSQRLSARGIVPDIWIDTRAEQSEPLPDLVQAAERREVQAIIAPFGRELTLQWLSRLSVPVAAHTFRPAPNCVMNDFLMGIRLAVEELARQGSRSVGMILPKWIETGQMDKRANQPSEAAAFFQKASELGLQTRESWLMHPVSEHVLETNSERFGYEAMTQLLALPDRPEGIFVTHDWVARGALMAVMERRISVPDDLKLVLHRNIELDFLCSLPVSYLDVSIGTTADALIASIDSQLRGVALPPVVIKPQITVPTGGEISMANIARALPAVA